MRLFRFALAIALPAAAGAASVNSPIQPQLSGSPSACPKATAQWAYRSGEAVKPQKLTELPDANMYSAVYRHDERGCESPIIVRYNVGRR
jgi:hypothetical protein